MDVGAPANPFSSHLVEPARGGYIFTGGAGLDGVLTQLRGAGWRGELIGPCGAGKSTLLTDIQHALEGNGRAVVRWQCSDVQRHLPAGWLSRWREAGVILVDGAERLNRLELIALRLVTRQHRQGLVITTHRRVGVGTAIWVRPNPKALAQKIAALLSGQISTAPAIIDTLEDQLCEQLAYRKGNAREVLFDLYAEFEREYAS